MKILEFLHTLLYHRRIIADFKSSIEHRDLEIKIMASFLNDYADSLNGKNSVDEFLTISGLRK